MNRLKSKNGTSLRGWSRCLPRVLFPVSGKSFLLVLLTLFAVGTIQSATDDNALADAVDPLMAQAVKQMKAGQFESASKLCKEVSDKLGRIKGNSAYLKAKKNMAVNLQNDIHRNWGKSLMTQSDNAFRNAEFFLGKNPKKVNTYLEDSIRYAKDAAKHDPSLDSIAILRCRASEDMKYEQLKLYSASSVERIAFENERKLRRDFMKKEIDPLIASAYKKYSSGVRLSSMYSDYQNTDAEHFFKESVALYDQALKRINAKYPRPLSGQEKPSDERVRFTPTCSSIVEGKKTEISRLKHEIYNAWMKDCIYRARQASFKMAEASSKQDDAALKKHAQALSSICRLASSNLASVEVSGLDQLDELRKEGERIVRGAEFRDSSSLKKLSPRYAVRQNQISTLLREGDLYYKNRQYEKARDSLEQVLLLDPYNGKAARILQNVYGKLRSIAALRNENEILERINENEWKWSPNIVPMDTSGTDIDGPQSFDGEGKSEMYSRLQTIIIPSVDFSPAQISDAIAQLRRRSKDNDPEKRGIDIIYKPMPGDENKEVRLSVSNMPIGEIIRYLCQATGLKYKVEEHAIRIAMNVDDMDMRSFKMSPALFNHISKNVKGDSADGGKGGGKGKNSGKEKKKGAAANFEDGGFSKKADELFKGDSESDDEEVSAASNEELKSFFSRLGISFGEGSKVMYDQRTSTLFVTNTPENLRRMEQRLREIDIPSPMVLVESKIIEINITDLEELGFDWTLTKNNSNPNWLTGFSSKTGTKASSTGTSYIMQTLTRHYGGSKDDFSTVDATKEVSAMIDNMQIIPNFGPDGAYNVFLTVNAIDQSERGELLSAPKVIALSGNTATVELSRQMYFPESWDDPEVTSSNNTYEYTPPVPDFGDAVPIGVVFSVKPDVSPNNHTIQLNLHPSIKSLTGWSNYDYEIVIGDLKSPMNEFSPKIKMPEIAIREIDTNVKVYDGETVILGGILQEESLKRGDQYPFMGEIPLMGRLFKNESKLADKKNLIIFVTPRMMTLDGVPIQPKKDDGLFDFKR